MSVTVYCRGYYITSFGLEDSFPEYVPTEQEFNAYEKLYELYLEKWLEKNTLTEEEWAKCLDREGDDYIEYIRGEWDSWKNDVWEDFCGAVDYDDPNANAERKFVEFVGEEESECIQKQFAILRREIK